MTRSPLVTFPETSYPTLVVGDFNIHHPLLYPLPPHSAEEPATSFPYVSRSSELGSGLINQPGVYTRFPLCGPGRPPVLDLCFGSPSLLPFCQKWDAPSPLHWLRPRPCPNYAFASFYFSPIFLSQLVPDRLARARPLVKDFTVPPPPSLPPDFLLKPGSTDTSCASPLL